MIGRACIPLDGTVDVVAVNEGIQRRALDNDLIDGRVWLQNIPDDIMVMGVISDFDSANLGAVTQECVVWT